MPIKKITIARIRRGKYMDTQVRVWTVNGEQPTLSETVLLLSEAMQMAAEQSYKPENLQGK